MKEETLYIVGPKTKIHEIKGIRFDEVISKFAENKVRKKRLCSQYKVGKPEYKSDTGNSILFFLLFIIHVCGFGDNELRNFPHWGPAGFTTPLCLDIMQVVLFWMAMWQVLNLIILFNYNFLKFI